MKRSWILGCLLSCIFCTSAKPCTIISGKTKDGVVWAGNNEEFFFDFNTYLNVLPKTDELFGAVSFTYGSPDGFIQGGFNERGLFFDINALDEIPRDKQKDWGERKSFPGGAHAAVEHILRRCSTVQEVIDFIERYEFEGFNAGQLHVADREGGLAIINGSGVERPSSSFQVSTNFNVCSIETSEQQSCWRFPIAEKVFLEKDVSMESVREILNLTQQKQVVGTIYSNVVNLTTGDAYNYFGGDFTRPYHFNLKELLAKGKKSYRWVELFPEHPLARLWKSNQIGGPESALKLYEQLEKSIPVEKRRELLRHLFSNCLFRTHQYAYAREFFERWLVIADESDEMKYFYHGIVCLTNGNVETAKDLFAKQVAFDRGAGRGSGETLPWVARLNGTKIPKANAKFVLKGYLDAKFVCIDRGGFLPVSNFLNKTDDGWEGDFVLQPGENHYIFVVDGREVADPSNPKLVEIDTGDGKRKFNVREQ